LYTTKVKSTFCKFVVFYVLDGELMTMYRGRIKDMLVSLSQRLELAIESMSSLPNI